MEISADELLKKIQELEVGHAQLKQEMSKLRPVDDGGARRSDRARSQSVSPQRMTPPLPRPKSGGLEGAASAWGRVSGSFGHPSMMHRESRSMIRSGDSAVNIGLSERQCLNILESMGQSVHIFDPECRIIYWNQSAEKLYGYSSSEALGKHAIQLLVDACDFNIAGKIVRRLTMGESWTGKFPVKNKLGDRFVVVLTNTPFYDDDGSLVGIIVVSSDSRSFQDLGSPPTSTNMQAGTSEPRIRLMNKHDSDLQQPIQVAIASKITKLATKVTCKVWSRIKLGEHSKERENGAKDGDCSDHDAVSSDHKEDGSSSGAKPSTTKEVVPFDASDAVGEKSPGKEVKSNQDEDQGKPSIFKLISKTESFLANKGISWPWKGHEHDGNDAKKQFVWPWLHSDQENDDHNLEASESGRKPDNQVTENNHTCNISGTSSHNANSTSSISSNCSTSSSTVQRMDMDSDCLDYEILWEDLTIGEQIGQAFFVYPLVAKKQSGQNCDNSFVRSCGTVYHALWYGSDVAVKVFSKNEYSDDLIVSFRQEVSLMKRLRHPNILLFMGAVASPNRLCIVTEFLPRLWEFVSLVAKKNEIGLEKANPHGPRYCKYGFSIQNQIVGDFGLSRLKHETYLTTKSGKGTPQWMAPEVLRNEPSDEKSDVYSYGVVLWELVTEKIPWYNLNSMQVIAAVGFMDQRLDLPADLDQQWVSIIQSCWQRLILGNRNSDQLSKNLSKDSKICRNSMLRRVTHRVLPSGESVCGTAKLSFQDQNKAP
ncbi:hypothetical protein ZIOFF_005648 [Zingiber officinale]|uniref:Uncharacterized protein n=1 Tax=Zingiber officinale TaxID=94328 RepID=A0A8J5LV04_ZINOF|nr:hypothetical protein ZIOFF_005648 [Zingiber officinale]